MRRATCLALLFASPAFGAPEAASDELVRAPGWEVAAGHCGACHSYRLVTAQRGDARFWTDVIRWMQRTQGLWDLPAEQEATLVAYLADAYGEEEWGRRPPLSPRLLPPLPAAENRTGAP